MQQLVAEAFVVIAHSQCVAEKICAQIQDFFRSIVIKGSDRLLNCEDGCVIISPSDNGLSFLVSATDFVIFHGIQTLLEGGLSTFADMTDDAIEWLPAEEAAFRSFCKADPTTDTVA